MGTTRTESFGMSERLFYRVSEIGELIGCSKSKAYELVANGTIPSTRIGTLLRVSRPALEALVKKAADEPADSGVGKGGK